MRLIGAGLPRTATLSQKVALEMLGVGPCYHMVDVLADLDRIRLWRDAYDGRGDWDTIFAGYDSTVDWPGSYHTLELVDRYPDAKVLLSVRPGEAWAKSMRETILSMLHGPDTLLYHLSRARGLVEPGWRGFLDLMALMWGKSGLLDDTSPAGLAKAMKRYNDEITSSVESVLVWSPQDGWEPLCELLELPVPDAPFPHANDSAMFNTNLAGGAIAALTAWRAQEAPAG
jgi:Sulfotransferase domain